MSRPKFRLFVGIVVLTFAALPAFAQFRSIPGRVNGQVRYAQGGESAFNITVRCGSFRGGVIGESQTDRLGKFSFMGLKPDQYIITVHTAGFKDEQQTVDLMTATSAYVAFVLRPDESSLSATPTPSRPAVLDAKVPPAALKEYEQGRSALLNEAQVERGIQHLEKAISIYPSFLEAELLLGTARMDIKQWDKAESALRHALAINSKHVETYVALGELYRQQKKYPEAEKALLDGLKLQERSWQGHLTLGRVYYDMGDMSKAGPQVGKALVLKPDLAEARLLGGNILLRAHRPADALVQFEEYLRLEPKGKFAPQAREIVAKIKGGLAEQKKRSTAAN